MPPGQDLVALGADLEPGTLLAAYQAGVFPMGRRRRGGIEWWSPDPRGVLRLDQLRVSASLRRSRQDYEVRVDTAFAEVVGACADPRRPQGWITGEIARAYQRLHEGGWAHSVECWRDGDLVGGLYGVSLGGVFAGESMFHHRRDASKVALVWLVELLREDGDPRRFIDVQWQTPHLAGLGVEIVARPRYLSMLATALECPQPGWAKPEPNASE